MADTTRIETRFKSLYARTVILLFFGGMLLAAAGCGDDQPPIPIAVTLTPTLQPTPTLVAALSAAGPGEAADARPSPASPTPSPTSTPVRPPEEMLLLADRSLELGNSADAAGLYRAVLASDDLGEGMETAALLGLGRAELGNDNRAAAAVSLTDYLALSPSPDSAAYFWLAQAVEDPVMAAGHYRAYLLDNPEMAAYIQPRIAALNPAGAETALLAALDADAHYLVPFNNRRQLAELYLQEQRFAEAITQFEAMRELARTENTKGELTYRIGQTFIMSDDLPSAYRIFQVGVNNYPRAYESYLGLVALVEAEQPVDPFQRGLVDYYAQAYLPAVNAFGEVVAGQSDYRPDTHLFMAWSYEGAGDVAAALAQLDLYLRQNPDNPEFIATYYEEKAALLTRSVSVSQAIDTLQEFARRHPEHPRVPWALWRSGVLADRFQEDPQKAIPLYQQYVDRFPEDENASDALFRIGMMHFQADLSEEAIQAWEAAAAYEDESGRAALVWLIRSAAPAAAADYKEIAVKAIGSDYYSLRARDIGRDLPAYAAPGAIDLTDEEAAAREEVEEWLRTQFDLGEETPVNSQLTPSLATDPRLIRGEKLWRLGLTTEAKRELEAVREQYAQNAQISYQLALYFRDLGLYRSSILAAEAVLTRAGVSAFDAPPLIGRLAYPVYYADLILPLAREYRYDALLQFALIRQESLFESFIASGANAQGLSQIIPDTGQFIADRLRWPEYQNEDLYRPYLNLQFGAYYLDQQLDLFEGEVAPALAAYNAGPGNALRWHETAGDDHDLFLETVNFAETRLYIRRIYIGQAIYRHLYRTDLE